MSIEQTKLFKKRIETPDLSSNTLYSKDIIGNAISYDRRFTTEQENFTAYEKGRGNSICVQFTKEHFITGRIGKIEVPYLLGENKSAYLAVQVYYAEDDQNVSKTLQETVFSNQKCEVQKGDGISEFYFDNLILPDEYRFVRFIFAQNDTEVPDIFTGDNCEFLRVRIISPLNNKTNYNWDSSDDCKVFTDTNSFQKWYGYVNIVRLHSVIDEIKKHKNDKIVHITEQERERWNSILSPIQEKVFNNYDTTLYTEGYDNVGTIVLSRKHFISGNITKITLPHDNYNASDISGGYLAIQVFGLKDGEIKQISDTIYSEQPCAYTSSSSASVWVFNDCELPDDYAYIHLSVVPDKTVTPAVGSNTNCKIRIKCLAKNGNKEEGVVYVEDDECRVYWHNLGQNGANYVAIIQAEYYVGTFDMSEFSQLVSSIEEHLSSDVHLTDSQKTAIGKVSQLETTVNNHIGDNTHLTDAQKTSISQISIISAGLDQHKGDTDIHVTADDKDKWNNHVDDDTIHVTQTEKDKWNSIEIPEIPEQIVYKSGNNVTISTDNYISIITTDVINESDMIPTSKAVHDVFFENKSFNNYDASKYTYLPDTVGTIVLSKKHFISGGKITKLRVPHGNTQDDLKNGQGGFLVIDVFKENDTDTPSHRYWADDYYAYKNRLNEGHYEWTFNERECIIPDDYKVVHLSLVVDEANVSKVGVTSSSNAQFRINCLAKNGNRDEGVVYEEDDECKLYWQGGANGANRVAIVEVDYVVDKLANLSQNEKYDKHLSNTTIHVTEEDKERWNTHIGDGTHLTTEQKTAISKVSEIETDLSDHIGDDTHLTTGQKEDIGKISEIETDLSDHIKDDTVHISEGMLDDIENINKEIETIHKDIYGTENGNYYTYDFNSPLPSSSSRTPDEMDAKVMVLDKLFFPWGQITEIELPYVYGENATVYMAVQIIEKGEAFNAPKTAAQTIYSTNSQTQVQGGTGTSTFTFSNLYVPSDFEAVRLSFVSDTSKVPDYYCNNCTAWGVQYVDFANQHIDSQHFEIWDYYNVIALFGAIIRAEYNRKSAITNIQKTVYQISTLTSSLSSHIEEFNAHKSNDTHLTAEQKTTIGKVSGIENNVINLTKKYNDITEILNNWSPDIETFSTLDSGAYVIKSGGKSNATGVQLSREHFTTGSIKMIQIYHADGMNVTNDIRLCAIVYNHGETEETQKTIDDCIFSTNTQSQMSGVGGCMCFNFNDLELPNDYEFVRFIFADATKYVIGTNISNETHVIPVHTDGNTIVEARVQILAPKVAGTQGEYIESPDDDCKTLHKTGSPAWSNWYPHVRAVKTVAGFSQIISLINRVSQLESRVNELEKS